jgi:alkane 1-monooxygenase
VPLLELLSRPRPDGLTEEEVLAAAQEPLFDAIVYLVVPLHWALLLLFLSGIGDPALSGMEVAGRTATMGVLCGVYGINVGHELGHRVRKGERDLARLLLLSSLYMHFLIEHNRGHHRRVATPEDPASARYGEPVYLFWARTLVGSFLSAWRIERDRQRSAGRAAFGWRNEMLQALLLEGAWVTTVGMVWGGHVLVLYLVAALIGVLLLETVNYIEHYGLQRVPRPGSGWARVGHVHSWNSDHIHGRLLLFELTRHSDHHYKASKKYQLLESIPVSPQLPTGYPGMMLLSLVPPAWYRVVHPRLQALVAADPSVRLATASGADKAA